jgi:hypothetical protein
LFHGRLSFSKLEKQRKKTKGKQKAKADGGKNTGGAFFYSVPALDLGVCTIHRLLSW